MPRSTLRQYAAAAVCCSALGLSLLAGCTGDSAAPAPLDPESSESTASTDPTPTQSPDASPTSKGPPRLPAEARGTTRASAGPFVRYWVDTLNYATTHLAPWSIRRQSFPMCQACEEAASVIARIKRDGGEMSGEGWNLTRVELLPVGRSNRPQVRAYITFAPSVVVERAGAKPRRFAGGKKTIYTFELGVRRGQWATAGIVGVPQ